MEMTEEEKMRFMTELAKSGVNISQINFGNGTQNFYLGKESNREKYCAEDAEVVVMEDVVEKSDIVPDDDLFHFIHPAITDDNEKQQIHKEVSHVVRTYKIADICSYLNTMQQQGRILQPQDSRQAMAELQRMGMPDSNTTGYTLSNFQKYYRK